MKNYPESDTQKLRTEIEGKKRRENEKELNKLRL